MFRRLCLLCLILSCRCVIGRLPVDVSPINTFKDYVGRVATRFSGVHTIVFTNKTFFVLSKNHVSSLEMSTSDGKTQHKVAEIITWPSTTSSDNLCRAKTRDTNACNNYIRIFAKQDAAGNKYLVCGTHSFDPKCRTYVAQGNMLRKEARNGEFSGKSVCPYDPKQTGASLYIDGDLYAATFEDFLGQKPVIYRHSVSSSRVDLERTKRDETWLKDPWFVKLVEYSEKVYILFKETAIEDNTGLTYTRVAQICQSDNGGEQVLRKQFTTYAKARLNCSFPGNPPFYFDELGAATDFYQLPGGSGKKILFAAMNTPKNSIWGSAVCAYLLDDIETTLQQPYMEQNLGVQNVYYWSKSRSDPAITEALSRCQFDGAGKSVLSAENLQYVRDHPLKSQAVPTWSKVAGNIPLFMKLNAEYQFTAIAVDPKAGSNSQFFVLMLGTTDGKILKIIPPISGSLKETHFIGEIDAYDEEKCVENGKHDRHVRDIKIDKESGNIIVAFSSCIVSVPLCPVSSSCHRACIAAQDPYCAWYGGKCVKVLKSQAGEQDVLNGDVSRLPSCEPPTKEDGTGTVDKSDNSGPIAGKPTAVENATSASSNATVAVGASQDVTTAAPSSEKISAASSFIPGVIGAGIGIVVCVVLFLIWCRCQRSSKSSDKSSGGDRTPTKERNPSYEEKRNSHSIPNHAQRQHSKRSNSSMEEDDAFLENGSDGNANSLEKARRKREMSTNRKSNTSSYRREDSIEKTVHPGSINRQTSRESNPDSNKESATNEDEGVMYVTSDFTQPPSPPMGPNHVMHRTLSASAPDRRSQIKRQLSLQIPSSNHQTPKYHHNLTPMPGTQNPLDIQLQQYAQHPGGFPPGAYDQTWLNTPVKNLHPRQYQSTSLDRKRIKAGGLTHAIPHDVQQLPRTYADTLPAMDEQKVQSRRRYPSDSMATSNRAPPLYFASKQPVYQSIKEETSPSVDQNTPTKFPPNMAPRTVGRQRPNHLPLGMVPDQTSQYAVPNTGTPMADPRYVMSPMGNAGHTLPAPMRRQFSEGPKRSFMPQQDFPHPQSAPNMKQFPPGEKLSKSNPATPEWDGNHNSFFPEPVDALEMRTRHPSGKATTPSSQMKPFPGYQHQPDVVPNTSAQQRPQPGATYTKPTDPLESAA